MFSISILLNAIITVINELLDYWDWLMANYLVIFLLVQRGLALSFPFFVFLKEVCDLVL
jgi:hypothetical protein